MNILVLNGSPRSNGNISGQLKCAIDRSYKKLQESEIFGRSLK